MFSYHGIFHSNELQMRQPQAHRRADQQKKPRTTLRPRSSKRTKALR